jgi:hypothetical protein
MMTTNSTKLPSCPRAVLGFIVVVLKNQIAGYDILPWLSKVQIPNFDI